MQEEPKQEPTNEPTPADTGADPWAEPGADSAPPGVDARKGSGGLSTFTRKVKESAEHMWSASYEKAKETAGSGRFASQGAVRAIDRILEWSRRTFSADIFENIATWCVAYGHWGLVAAQVLVLLCGLVAGVKLGSWVTFLFGIGVSVVLVILQYTASRFLNAGDALIRTSPSQLGSPAFLDCMAVLSEAAGIMLFLACLLQRQWSFFWIGLGLWALLDAIAYIALHPSLANITLRENARAGEEAIGIMSFAVKAVVRIVPIAFGAGSILGAVALLFSLFSVLRNGDLSAVRAATRLVTFSACLPVASYVLFTFYHLAIDVLRALLSLPQNREQRVEDQP